MFRMIRSNVIINVRSSNTNRLFISEYYQRNILRRQRLSNFNYQKRNNYHSYEIGIPLAFTIWAGISTMKPNNLYEAEMAFAGTLALSGPPIMFLPMSGYLVFIWLMGLTGNDPDLWLQSSSLRKSHPPMVTFWLHLREWGLVPGYYKLTTANQPRFPIEIWGTKRVWLFEDEEGHQEYFDCGGKEWDLLIRNGGKANIPFSFGRNFHGGNEIAKPNFEKVTQANFDFATGKLVCMNENNEPVKTFKKVEYYGELKKVPLLIEDRIQWCKVEIIHREEDRFVIVRSINDLHVGVFFEGVVKVPVSHLRDLD